MALSISTRALAVAVVAVALVATAEASTLRKSADDDDRSPFSSACIAPCASLHRVTTACVANSNDSSSAVTPTCGYCLPGFYGSTTPTIPCIVNETYWTGADKQHDDDSDSHDDRGPDMSVQGAVGSGLGSLVVLLMCVITWRGWFDCCRHRRDARESLRAFLEPTTSEWTCTVCLHTNSSLRRYCVLCKSEVNEPEVDPEITPTSTTSATSKKGASDDYVLVETPRSRHVVRPFAEETRIEWTDDQRVACERLEWKRCVEKNSMRWIRFHADEVRRTSALRGTIVRAKDLDSPAMGKKIAGIQSTAPIAGFFVVQDMVMWRPVEQAVFDGHPYRQWHSIQKVASMSFDDRLRWFQQRILKLRHLMREQLFTIHVHRDNILKQTMQLFQTTPATTLRRHLRVDFLDEPGIDGGGILREWLQVICKELFCDGLGLFKRTASTLDSGYWINRSSARKSQNQLEMYQFFGMFLAKAVLEGLVLNVRLASPLLKHLLGSPLSKDDLRFLDDQIHSSVCYILENKNVDELSLTFAIADRDLIPGGSEVGVTDDNKHLYVDHLVQYYLFDSVADELRYIIAGFRMILPTTPLHVFDHRELDLVLSGLSEIDVLDWQAHTNVCLLGHDVKQEQQLVDWFWEIVTGLSQRDRSRLLQYVTGSSGVPVEGFAALTSLDGHLQPFTIQLTDIAAKTYSTLPYASTCFNRLDLPVYETKSDLQQTIMLLVGADVTGFNRR